MIAGVVVYVFVNVSALVFQGSPHESIFTEQKKDVNALGVFVLGSPVTTTLALCVYEFPHTRVVSFHF